MPDATPATAPQKLLMLGSGCRAANIASRARCELEEVVYADLSEDAVIEEKGTCCLEAEAAWELSTVDIASSLFRPGEQRQVGRDQGSPGDLAARRKMS